MPRNLKEELFFSTLVCVLMVSGMSIYNLALHHDLSWQNFAIGIVPGVIVAFLLDLFVIGVAAKKIAFKLPFATPEKPITMILSISTLMIIGMVTCMSMFGLLMEGGISEVSAAAYGQAWVYNVIMALPLQLLVVGPIGRFALGKFQQNTTATENALD